ncbi:MAG: hypothetical protein ACE5J0_00440 [Candidatus Paceibacterales bacterium]
MKLRKIGFDLDGTITCLPYWIHGLNKLKWPWFLYLIPSALGVVNRKTVELIRRLKKKGYEIIIISARPDKMTKFTSRWLKRKNIPYDKLFCVGGQEKEALFKKIKIVKKERIKAFVDLRHT